MWPGDVDGWIETAVVWLLDTAVAADWREVEVLWRYPVVLARFVTERMEADLAVAREAWTHIGQLADGVSAQNRDEVEAGARALLRREGPRASAAPASARLLEQALRGERWVPRL